MRSGLIACARRHATLLALLVLAVCAVGLFVTAPRHGEFWYSDAPRHALNGIFVKDLLRDLPLADPQRYAIDYYLKYPALTILFYPPLLYLVSAPFFAVLGVSHATAQLVITGFYFAYGAGAHAVARRWLAPPLALATAVLAMGVPEFAMWGRQVMQEIPASAFLIWSIYYFLRYLDGRGPGALYMALFLMVCGIYTKLTLAFMLPVLALALLVREGWRFLRGRHVWIAGGLCALGLLPLVAMTIKFGQGNVQSVASVADSVASRGTIAGWVWYLGQLPGQLTWPVTALAAGFVLIAAVRGEWRRDLPHWPLLGLWLGVGYVFFSSIDLKDSRLDMFVLWPVILAAMLLVRNALPERAAAAAALVLAAATFAATLAWRPVPAVAGYAEAAAFVSQQAPRDSVVLFSGKRDGSFIFSMRAHEERADLSVLRADKILLRVAIKREQGVEQKQLSAAEIVEQLAAAGVVYVVAERDFWTDLEVMERFQRLLDTDQFEEVKRIGVTANVPTEDKELRIYRNRGPVATGERRLRLELPTIGRDLEGSVGGK